MALILDRFDVVSAISRARQRAADLRSQARRIEAERADRHGRADDGLATITVDDLGQLVEVSFSSELANATPTRWATSLVAVHGQACAAVRVADPLPATVMVPNPTASDPTGPAGRATPGGATPGRALAPEQQATAARTDAMVAQFERFSARQAERQFIGSADDVCLTFDGALGLRQARATAAALGRGPAAMARAVLAAWQDARTQFTAALDLERF